MFCFFIVCLFISLFYSKSEDSFLPVYLFGQHTRLEARGQLKYLKACD